MLIICSHCSARVNGEPQKLFPVYNGDKNIDSGYRVSLLACPACRAPIVGWEELLHYQENDFGENPDVTWSVAKRVWPNPESPLDPSIPKSVQVSLNEARSCLSGGNYTASVVMSGRALEAVARHLHVGGKADRLMLAKGLEELHTNKKIDERLYQWGKELHEHRNLAAHASDRTFSREDAEDLFEFVNAICDYLFVLQDRYDRFVVRKNTHPEVKAPDVA
jgi:hypothetical protein